MPHRLLIVSSLLAAAGCNAGSEETIPVQFTLGDFMSGDGIEHLDVCVLDTANCDVTDADGTAHLSLPVDSDVVIGITGGGYNPSILPIRTSRDLQPVVNYLTPEFVIDNIIEASGLPVDRSLARLGISLVDPQYVPVAGYSATMPEAEGPYYLTELSSSVGQDLEATSGSGRFAGFNFTGDFLMVTVDGPGTCLPAEKYWQGGPNEAPLPMAPGFTSGVTMICE